MARVRVTKAEARVWALVARGLAAKAIAHRLDRSENTIMVQMRALFKAVGCTNKVQLALAWHELPWENH